MEPATEAFVGHRNLLFTVAYELLGSATDAEDVLQETWLRWVGVDLDTVRNQRAYLVQITTRQALGGCARYADAGSPTSGRGCPSRC
jgi:RNA polymerase sigma-70 factor (ECF subfamily)